MRRSIHSKTAPLVFAVIAVILVALAARPAGKTAGHPDRQSKRPALRVSGAAAQEFLGQPGDGQSLMAALQVARFSLKPEEHSPFDQASGPGYLATSHDQNLNAWFGQDGVTLRPTLPREQRDQAWQLAFHVKAYGYGTKLVAVPPIVSQQVKGTRIEYEHAFPNSPPSTIRNPQLLEWYENRAEGIEQGFTLGAPPEIRDQKSETGDQQLTAPVPGKLRLALELTGDLTSEATEDGQALLLKDQRGQIVAHYAHLKAWDATGRELAARMRVNGREVSLEVEDAGATYPVTIDPTFYQEIQKLTVPDGVADDDFGGAVAISENTAVVGATGRHVAYFFVRDGAKWSPQGSFMAGTSFGKAVAIDGNTAIIGDTGAAHVFVRSGTTWSEQQILTASDGAASDHFADSVGISGDNAVVGAPYKDQTVGAAYVFKRNGTTWLPGQKLVQNDRTPKGTANNPNGDLFGYAVAISGNTAIVGAPADDVDQIGSAGGSVYIYLLSDGVWREQAFLTAPPGRIQIGSAVAIDGNRAVVGSGYLNGFGAYVTERISTSWSALQQLPTNSGEALTGDGYGSSVAISGQTALVGAPGTNNSQGVVYVFGETGGTWSEQGRFTGSDAEPNVSGAIGSEFGGSVALSSDTPLIGARYHSVGAHRYQGQAYLFILDTDGDGIPDEWEKNGVTFDGVFLNLPAMGADPRHKDVFVHVEWFNPNPANPGLSFKPDPRAVKIVTDAFAIAPADQVNNPDGQPGINLHVDLGPDSIMNPVTGQTWESLSRTGADDLPHQYLFDPAKPPTLQSFANAFASVKTGHFDPAKRATVFHYLFYCDAIDLEYPAGRGFLGKADFAVSDSGRTIKDPTTGAKVRDPIEEADTFMHELGHNLGLQHGGGDEVIYKPNYISIMNYRFDVIGTLKTTNGQRYIDYSRRTLDTLNETSLDETVGINDPDGHATTWKKARDCIDHPNSYYKLFYPSKALDWNCDGLEQLTPLTEAVDINGGGNKTEVLKGFADWPALVFNGGGKLGHIPSTAPAQSGVTTNFNVAAESGQDNELPHELTYDEIAAEIPPALITEQIAAPLDVVTFSPRTGGAPLVVNFDGSASTAHSGTIVSWSWDFGDGTTGTGKTVMHTYNTLGTYFAKLTVTDSNGHINLVPLLNRVAVTNGPGPTPTPTPTPKPTPTPSTKPNLVPYKPAGWSDKLVVSKSKGTHADSSPLLPTDKLYVDFAVINNGGGKISTSFVNKLYVDEVLVGTFTTNPPLNPSGYFYVEDFPAGPLRSGQHSIKVVADAGGAIAESDESDNEYTKIITVATTGATPGKYTVKSTADSGPDTLRQAITDANGHPNADSSTPDVIEFAIPGTNLHTIVLATKLPEITDAVVIDGYSQPGSTPNTLAVGNNAVLRVEVNGNFANNVFGYGLQLQDPRSAGSTIRGLVLNRYYYGGIIIFSDNNVVEGCFFDTNAAGNTRVAGSGQGAGITIYQGANNRIGGTAPAARNVIAGDYIGIILGNDNLNGVANTLIQGNYIGTNAAGTAALHKTDRDSSGVYIGGVKVTNTIIGGTQPGAGNVISGNGNILGGYGIQLGPAGDVTIQGNLIGTNGKGTAAIGNPTGGIKVVQTVTHLLIGGAASGARNIISGNGTFSTCAGSSFTCLQDGGIGILAGTTNGIAVQGNYIGTGSDGVTLIPNRISGIEIFPRAGMSYLIGGTNPGEGNIIAGNARTSGLHGFGVQVERDTFLETNGTVSILGNSIFSNEGLGIALTGCPGNSYCVLTNDFGDADQGANGLQNYAVLGSVSFAGGNVTIEGTLNSAPNKTYRLEFFANKAPDPSRFGQGQFYLGFTSVTTNTLTSDVFGTVSGNAAFKVTFPAPTGARYASATATDPGGNTSEFSAVPGQALNISTRLRVQKGENVLIGGFIVTGTAPKKMIIRAIGPSLGITGALADPTLELHDATGAVIAFNNNWKDTQQADIEGSGIPPSNDLESAIARTLTPGNYTAIVRGKNDTAGIALVEGYDLSATPDSKVANISTRGFVEAGDNVMIGGFIVGPAVTGTVGNIVGGTCGDTKVLIRAIGPSLPVDGKLADPTLELHDRNGALIESNDNWSDSPNKLEIIATTIPPLNVLESAIVRTLAPDNYTAIVRGVNNTTGVALVEVYVLN